VRATPDGLSGNQKMTDKLIAVDEVAEYLRVKVTTVYEWAKEGKIPAAKVGRLWRFDREEIEAWVKSRKPSMGVEATNNEARVRTSHGCGGNQ